MNALLLDHTHPLLEQGLEQGGIGLWREYELAPKDFPSDYFTAEVVVIRSRFPVTREVIDLFPNLKAVGRLGAGLENIDVDYAESRGIACLRVPEGNAQAVAEHSLGMLLGLLNHRPRVHREIKEGVWRREENKGLELRSRTVGIIGYGVMGSQFARLLAALGVIVFAYDKYKTGYADAGITESTLEELQQKCDIISLHLPLTQETRYFADDTFFNAFQNPIYFLNTARGPILQTEALVRAMKTGSVRGAGLDVLEFEKKSFTSVFEGEMPHSLQWLMHQENVILSPHIAGWTKESFEKMGASLAAKILDVL